jgi:hypothetical protein
MKLIDNCSSILLSGMLLISCGTSKEERGHSDDSQVAKERMVIRSPVPIPPNTCRVIATIQSIELTSEGANDKDPCGKAPCLATVRIDSVLGFGSAFPSSMSSGKIIQVKFVLTLNSTKEILPEVTPALPGLSVGSRFEALINGSMAMGKTEPVFTIYGYEKQ